MIKLLAAKRGVKPAAIKSEDEIERRRKLKLENDNYVARQAEIKNIVDTATARPAPLYDNQRVEPPKTVFKTNGFQPALIMPTEPPPVVTGSGSAGSIVKLANGKYKVVKAGDSNVQSDVPALGSDDIGVSAEEQASERLYNSTAEIISKAATKDDYEKARNHLVYDPMYLKLGAKGRNTANALARKIAEFEDKEAAAAAEAPAYKKIIADAYRRRGMVEPEALPGDDNPITTVEYSAADKIKALTERLELVKWYGYAPVTTTANGYGEKGDAAVIEAELKRLKKANPDWNMNPDDYYDFSAAERAKKEQDAARKDRTVNFAAGDSGFKDMVAYDAIIEKGTRDYTVRIEKGVKNGADVRIFNENTNEEERRNLAWIYGNAKNSKDIEVADRYREKLETLAKERQYNKAIDEIHESDPSGGWLTAPIVYTGRAAASMEAVPTYIAETALNLAKNMAEGTDYPVPTSSEGSSLIRRANHAEETIIKNVPEELKPLARLGISAADSFIGAYISGPASPLILSMSAGAGAAYDAGERGATGTQQLLTGIAQGGAEYFGEKLSFKGLEKWMNTSAGGAKEFALRALNQSIVEGNEEAATEIANVFSDLMIMGDKSNVQEYCANYMASHPGAKDAETILNAGLYIFGRTAEAWMGGAISGGVMGGAAQGVGAARTKRADSARTEAINTLAGAQIDKSYEVFKESGLFSDEAAAQLEKAGFAAAARKYDAARLATADKVKEGSKFHELPIFGRDGSGKTVPIFHDDLQERRSRLAAGAENLEASTPAKIAFVDKKSSSPVTASLTDEGNLRRYQKDIDGVFDGTRPHGKSVILGATPDIFLNYGAAKRPIHISQSTAMKIAYPEGYPADKPSGKHNLGISALKHLPEQLADPVAILKNPQAENSLIILTEWQDTNEKAVIVPIHLDKQGTITITNEVATAFGVETEHYMNTLLGENNANLLYTKNNESITQLLSNRRHMPEAKAEDTLNTHYIPQNEENVKGGEKSGSYGENIIGAAQALPSKSADQLVDEYGAIPKGEQPRAREGKPMVLPPVFRDGNPVSPVIETAPIEERNRKLEESRRALSEADELLTEEEKSEIEKVNKLDDVELADFYRGEDERASNDEISTRVEAFRAFQALEEGVPVDKALPTKTLRFVQAAEKAFNVKIRFSNKLASGATLAGAAAYDGDTGEIVVDPQKAVRADIANTIVMHEATHRLESMAEYPRLSSYAVKQRFGGENESFKKAVADKIAEYGRSGVTLTPESARREVVAEIISEQFSSEEDIKRLVTKQPKLAGRVLGAIRDACATIRTFVSSKGSRVSAVQELRRLQKLRGSLERAMREVKKSTAAKGDGDGVRYKIERGIDGNISAVDTPLEVDYTKEKGDESDVRPDKDNRGADSQLDGRGLKIDGKVAQRGSVRGGNISRSLDDVSPNARRTLDEKRKPNIGLKSSQNNPAAFSNALKEAIGVNKRGPYVIYHSAEELMADGAKLLLAENGMAGVAVFSDGNIGAVFNNDKSPVRGAADDLMLTALANGGNKLDNFDGRLSDLYVKYGFEPVARVAFDPPRAPEGWRAEFGKPDVIFWKHNGDSVDTVAEKIGKYDLKDLSRLPLFAEYDEAYAYRDSLILENAAITGKESSTDDGAALSSAQKGDVTDGGKVQNYLGEGDPNAFYEAEAARFNRWFKARKMSTINELIASSKEFASAKARGVSGKTKNAFLRSWADSFYLDAAGKRLFEEKMRVLENEIREDGKPQWRTKAALFDAAIENALESSPRMTEENEAVRATLRACRVNPSGIPAELIKKAQGKIRFSNSSSIGIDTFYGELSTEDPYRFPDSIWNIEDQAERIIEVYDSLAPNPAYLTDILAKEELEMVRDDFFRGLMAVENEFRNAIKYDSERTDAIATKAEAKEPFDFKAYAAKANEIEQKRRVYERILRDTTLPKGDMDDVASLRKGHKEESEIRESYNKDYIIELARAGAALDELTAPLDNYRRQHGEKMLNWARELTKDSDLWKNPKLVAGYRLSGETQERNIIDVAGETEGKKIIEEIFTPVHKNTAKANVFKNSYRDTVKALKLNSDESIYVQLLGEGIVTLDAVPTKGDDGKVINKAKVERAIDVFHKMYAEMLEKVNFALVENGYKPIAMRKNYFPHFNESNDALTVGLKKLGIEINRDELPADIAGLTQAFRPGKKYNPHFEHRKGNSTIYDAVRGFDSYVEGVADVIFHTEDIARLRAFETALREKNTDSTVQAKIDEVRADPSLDAAEKYDKITELLAVDNTQNSAYINNILIYTNLLAGKKHIGDRAMEADVGRACYSLITALENRVAANMVAINPGSWLTNFIPLTQAAAAVKTKNLYRGMYAQLVSNWKNDGFSDRSTFMINRKGSELLYKSKLQSITSVLAHPMTMIDEFTSGAVARAKYYEMLESGATEESAMSSADSFAAAVIADRSKGALPTCFEMRNPVRKLFTQFQLEVKNQFSFLFKDLPREKAREGIAAIAVALLKYFIGAYIFNDCYELVTGRRAAFDPISIANDLIGDITGYKLPNMVSTAWGAAANGKAPNFKTEKKNAVQTALHLGDNILQEVPFVGGLLTDGGRLPISSALPDLKILGPAVLELWDEDIAKSRTWAKIGKEFAKPVVYMGAPFGGGQAKKIAEGLATVAVGGSYTLDKNGNPQMQFPVAQTAGNAIKAAVFGKYSLPEAKNYVDNGFITMSVDKTECVTKLYKSGMSFDEFLLHDRKLKAIKGDVDAAGKTIDNTASLKKRKYIDALGLTSEQNYLMYDASNISKTVANAPDIAVALLSEGTQKKATEAHDKTGLSYEKFAAVYDEISRTNKRDDIGKKEKSEFIREMLFDDGSLSTPQKEILDSQFINDGTFMPVEKDVSYESEGQYRASKLSPEKYAAAKSTNAVTGIDYEIYVDFLEEYDQIRADKNSRGNSVAGSKKKKVKQLLATLPIEEWQRNWLYNTVYDKKNSEAYVRRMVDRAGLSKAEADELYNSYYSPE